MRARRRRQIKVERARWHLWTTTFAVMAALVGGVLYLSDHGKLDQISFLPAGRLRIALGGIVLLFLAYVVDRERHLRRLGDRLTEERVESTRLSTELHYLHELQRERDTNAALLDGAADGVAVVDRDLRLLRFNDAMAGLSGIPAEQAVEGYAPAVLRFESADGTMLEGGDYPLRSVLDGGEPLAGLELRLQVAGESDRWVSGTFSPIFESGDRPPVLALAVLRDITETKEMQSMQRDFVSIVSHELRAPLTAIKGFAKTLLQRGDALTPETRHNFLSTVNSQADRLARLVDDLLQVSRIDARRLRVEIGPQQSGEVLATLISQFRGKWTRPIDLDVPDSLPPIAADHDKLEEVLINLIDNAVKYSPADAPIRVVAREERGEIEIAVEDRGAGISPEDSAKLFQKFQRLSTPATRDVGGTGLGLYIVKGLVDAMGGRVWVESAPGVGSTFAFALPVAEAASGSGAAEDLERMGA